MFSSTLASFIEIAAPLTLDYEQDPANRGRQLLAHKGPFLSTESPRELRYGGNLFGDRGALASHFGTEGLEAFLAARLNRIEKSAQGYQAAPLPHRPFAGDLRDLPFFSLESLPLSRYLTSGIVAIETEERGLNLSYHRMQYVSPDQLVMRVVRRHLHALLARQGGEPEP